MSLWHNIKKTFSDANKLNRLIYINVAVFLFLSAISIITYLFNNEAFSMKVLRLFAVPASLRTLAMKPWTLITYMFTHKDILHILFNMLWLYWFGRIFLEYLDQRKLVAVYILGGISGAIVYVLSFNIFPVFTSLIPESVAIGASASVMAVVVAIAAYVPNYPVHLLLIGKDYLDCSRHLRPDLIYGLFRQFGRKTCTYGGRTLRLPLHCKPEEG